MDRFITDSLIRWKQSASRKPLILRGVRQCGKTYALKQFGASEYQSVAYFNFEENKAIGNVFEQDFDVNRIVLELSAISNMKIEKGSTLVIFDEIQECGRALTSLKYFCENGPEYHIACAGSLLGIALHEGGSFPVGKADFLDMYPMSFSEFLLATGNNGILEYLNGFNGPEISKAIAPMAEQLLKEYLIVGGMPEAVATWTREKDVLNVERIQRQILSSYELDFAKHAGYREYPKLSAIWASIPAQLSKPNAKFIFSAVKKGMRAKDLEDALVWLIDAGLIYRVCKVEKPSIPLSGYADSSYFKIYFSDVGLLRTMAGVSAETILGSLGSYTEFKGAIAENFVLNELVKSSGQTPYYWVSGNSAEVDFLTQVGQDVVPIEVKAEKNTKAKSLGVYIDAYSPSCAVRASLRGEVGGDRITRLPLYLMWRLKDFAKRT